MGAAGRCSWRCFTTLLLVTTLLLITIGLLAGLVIIPILYANAITKYPMYGVVFAAESNHTNMLVYKWDWNKDGIAPNVSVIQDCHISAGLSSFNDTQSAAQSVHQCAGHLVSCPAPHTSCIPEGSLNTTQFHLLATDGMRLLNYSNSSFAEQLLGAVGEAIHNQTCNHTVNWSLMRGTDEGLAFWVSANTALLNQKSTPNHQLPGVLHLGSGSAQLVVASGLSGSNLPDKNYTLNLFGGNYTLKSVDTICAGWNESWKNITRELLKSKDSTSHVPVSHPCLPDGYTWTVVDEYSDLYHGSCGDTSGTSSHDQMVNFTGSGNVDKCIKSINKFLNYFPTYFINGNFTVLNFIGEVLSFFNTTNVTNSEGWSSYNSTLNTFCKLNWTMEKAQYPGTSLDGLSRMCFNGQLIFSLLTNKYGLKHSNHSNHSNWMIKGPMGNQYHWTTGYMLQQAAVLRPTPGQQVTERPYTTTSLLLSEVLLVVLIVMFGLFLASVLHISYTDRSKNSYVPIS